jgi:beta-N-acetylhexosaminidase
MIGDVIRGVIGFQGLLMSDDLSMNALQGTLRERAQASIEAGCDMLLHCNGKLAEMEEVAAAAPILAGEALRRADRARAARHAPRSFDEAAARTQFASMMAGATVA